MSLFTGSFPHTIDDKGRMSVPNKFRDILRAKEDNRLVITRGTHENCLSVFPMERWNEVLENLDQLPSASADDFIRYFIAPAIDCKVDKTGRVLIPGQLRDEVGLEKEVMVVGALRKFEIWDRENWDANTKAVRSSAMEVLRTEKFRF